MVCNSTACPSARFFYETTVWVRLLALAHAVPISSNVPLQWLHWMPPVPPLPLLQAQLELRLREAGGGQENGILLLIWHKRSTTNTTLCTQTPELGHQCHNWHDRPLVWWINFCQLLREPANGRYGYVHSAGTENSCLIQPASCPLSPLIKQVLTQALKHRLGERLLSSAGADYIQCRICYLLITGYRCVWLQAKDTQGSASFPAWLQDNACHQCSRVESRTVAEKVDGCERLQVVSY